MSTDTPDDEGAGVQPPAPKSTTPEREDNNSPAPVNHAPAKPVRPWDAAQKAAKASAAKTAEALAPDTAEPVAIAARRYGEQDLPIFPCRNTPNDPDNHKRPHTLHGFLDATTNTEVIDYWWKKWPDALIGMPTGSLTGIAVLDLDVKKGKNGLAIVSDWQTRSSVIARTQSGGAHLYFSAAGAPHCTTDQIALGVDTRGQGGYVIVPPSTGYTWVNGHDLTQLPPWPDDLRPEPHNIDAITSSDPEADPALVAAAMAVIPNDDLGFDEWNRIAMACWAGSGGKCFEAFDLWSQKSKKYKVNQTQKQWRKYSKSPPTKIGAGTIFYLADKAEPGWRTAYEEATMDDATRAVVVSIQELTAPNPLLPPSKELPAHLLKVPGLVGEIVQWITDTARYPQPALSLGAALTLVGTAAGRHIAGPTLSGTHLYIIGIAKSGAGKDHALSQNHTILDACREHGSGFDHHIGPSQFMSMPAVVNFLKEQPLALCSIDEMGAFLKRINGKRAAGFEAAISSVFRQTWGYSFGAYPTPAYANLRSVTIYSPALSIYGISTAEEFYGSLEGADIVNGLLNRFVMIETQVRPPENLNPRDKFSVPASIVEQMCAIYGRGRGSSLLNPLCNASIKPPFTKLDISPAAEEIRSELSTQCTAYGDADPKAEPFLARTAENAIRLATIATVGQGVDCIEVDTMIWARDFMMWSTDTMANGAGLYIADNENQAMARAVLRAITKAGGVINRSKLMRVLDHKYKTRELDGVIGSLVESGEVVTAKPQSSGGRLATRYMLSKK